MRPLLFQSLQPERLHPSGVSQALSLAGVPGPTGNRSSCDSTDSDPGPDITSAASTRHDPAWPRSMD
eukprot:782389-Rhodomonas_salina.1